MTNPTTVQHTPGPWMFDDTREHYGKPCVRHNGQIVCFIPDVVGNEANARLIAAAPRMLKVLRIVEADYVCLCDAADQGSDGARILALIQAVIREAKGE